MAACQACGAEVDPRSARFCHACGTPLPFAAAFIEALEERRIVTILFCDLVDSTSRFDLADPEDVRTTLASYLSRVEREICLLYTSPSPRDRQKSRMPSSA